MSPIKAAILFVAFIILGSMGTRYGWDPIKSQVSSYPLLLLGCLFIGLAGGVLLILLVKGALVLVDLVIFPEATDDPPPALYKLPQWYLSEGRFQDALCEYEKITKVHPQELACWTGMLEILVTHMGNVDAARKTARTGIRKLRSPEKQQQLRQYYLGLTGETLSPSLWS